MVDEVLRQKRKITPEEVGDTVSLDDLPASKAMKGASAPPEGGIEITGTMPPELQAMLEGNNGGTPPPQQESRVAQLPPQATAKDIASSGNYSTMPNQYGAPTNEKLTALLAGLQETIYRWEPVTLPSLGKFYTDIPGTIHVRCMTGEEEQILATPRYLRKGLAINMIFQNCIREKFQTEKLLSIDRTFLLIYLRGISYSPDYDVEVKCTSCGTKFSTSINLNTLWIDQCPNDFNTDSLEDTMPRSGFKFRYRLATGEDDTAVNDYRDRRIKQWGDTAQDDTMSFRASLLIEEIEEITTQREIQSLIPKLPIEDVSYIRNLIGEPPFGVNTDCNIMCPSCTEEFTVDLPMETNFFFPRRKKTRTRGR